MTIASIEIIREALAFYRLLKAKDLDKAQKAKLSKQAQGEAYVAESLKVSNARAEFEKVSTALAEFRNLRVAPLNDSPPEKSEDGTPKAVHTWIAYLRDQYSTAILSDEDLDVLRKLQTIF
jgi:hypothetical protein